MFKRNSKPPTVTPLPAYAPGAAPRSSPGLAQNGAAPGPRTPPVPPAGANGGYGANGANGADGAPPRPLQRAPPAPGMPRSSTAQALAPPLQPPAVERTTSAISGVSTSSKAEKRRSGFLGFGRKDKDKDKAKDGKSEPAAARNSLTLPASSRSSMSNAPSSVRPASQYQSPRLPPAPSPLHTPPMSDSTSSLNSSAPSLPSARSQPSSGQPGSRGSPVPVGPDMNPPAPGRPGQASTVSKYRGGANASNVGSVSSAGSAASAARGTLPRSTSAPLNDVGPAPGSPRVPGGPYRADAQVDEVGRAEWMAEFDPVVELIAYQPQKNYLSSPPELEMIQARTSAGQQPKQGPPGSPSNDWDAVWLQLLGISLSTWSMKETRAAAAKGDKVPPTYFNVTDSSLELLAALPPPPHRPDSHPHHYVFSLNTAGSNRLLFSCPSERDLAAWTMALRVSAYERARLEEIYTGHLVRAAGREPRSPLVRGRMEGWVRVRVMGGTEWKRLWAVVCTPEPELAKEQDDKKQNRRRSFFGIGDKDRPAERVQEPNTGVPMASFYAEPRTVKNKTVAPVLTITGVTQAYAVFPERLEAVVTSNLFKVVGRIGGDMVSIEGRLRDSGWALVIPDTPETVLPPANGSSMTVTPLVNMMRWVTGFHDAFGLYGRPGLYVWDEKDPRSLFFAYPRGERRNQLFLSIEEAMMSDFRTPSLPSIRAQFTRIVQQRLSGMAPVTEHDDEDEVDVGDVTEPARPDSFRLPPLSFDPSPSRDSHHSSALAGPRSLTPITERTDASRTNSVRTASSRMLNDFGPAAGNASAPSSLSGKQGSRDSDKSKVGSGGGGHLEAISDSAEALAAYADGDHDTEGHGGDKTPVLSPESVTFSEGATNLSGPTEWSQETGSTPSREASVEGREEQTTPTPMSQSQAQRAAALAGSTSSHAAESAHSHAGPAAPQPLPLAETACANQLAAADGAKPTTPVLSPVPRKASGELASGLSDEPAALYLMNIVEEPVPIQPDERRAPAPALPAPAPRSPLPPAPSPPGAERAQPPAAPSSAPSQPTLDHRPRPTINTALDKPAPVDPARGAEHAGLGLGRKPSGARAPPPRKTSGPMPRLEAIADDGDAAGRRYVSAASTMPDFGEDAAAFMAYADQASPAKPTTALAAPPPQPRQPALTSERDQGHPAQSSLRAASPAAAGSQDGLAAPIPAQPEGRSSFAPSQAARERRAKAEAAETERARNMSLPGGGRRAQAQADTWSGSSEDEDEGELDGADADVANGANGANGVNGAPDGAQGRPVPEPARRSNSRALPPVPRPNGGSGSNAAYGDEAAAQDPRASGYAADAHASEFGHDPRASRHSPHPPSTYGAPQPNGQRQSAYSQAGPANTYAQPAPPAAAPPPNSRASVWNANFSVEHGHAAAPASGKFVDLDEPGAQLTKAFAPHGLLQAGLQDREDRSAKRQEELARETGAALVAVPAKPPPPQTGLLGAVAAHERDRKHAGGLGATLTDRDRERRLAEDRQRKIDELQRQQMEHMSQFGAGYPPQYPAYPYGMPQMPSFSPYMSPPNYNPAQQQAMYAAQLAYQHAYQHAMYSLSAAGSQAGTPGVDDLAPPPGAPGAPGTMRPPSPGGSLRGPSPMPSVSGLPPVASPYFAASPYAGAPPGSPFAGGGSPFMGHHPHPPAMPMSMSMYGFPPPPPQPHSPYPPSPYGAAMPPGPPSHFRGSAYDLHAQGTGAGSAASERRD